ncbi:MAG: hypothetical protein ACRKGH_06170 [Dehalogenimonas sp.]
MTPQNSRAYNSPMQAVDAPVEDLFKHNPEILKVCREIGWGNIEIAVKDGKPVMVTMKKDIKLI